MCTYFIQPAVTKSRSISSIGSFLEFTSSGVLHSLGLAVLFLCPVPRRHELVWRWHVCAYVVQPPVLLSGTVGEIIAEFEFPSSIVLSGLTLAVLSVLPMTRGHM